MRFGHLGDCHLGGWRQPELAKLNFESFQYAISTCIEKKVDFILVAGDLFDSAYPNIDTIKEAFQEFKKIKDAGIPVFLIAGSHDYSVSGKTFLDVLEKAGFAKNVFNPEEKGDNIMLHPTLYKNVAIYGYPGKKSALEVQELSRIKLHESPGFFRILMLHTSLRDAVGSLPIPAVDEKKLPEVDYMALAHLHMKYCKENRVYCGPTFPNNAGELEELGGGSFYIVDVPGKPQRYEIKLKDVEVIDVQLKDALTGTEQIIDRIKKHAIEDKIVILKVKGVVERGKIADIDFFKIDGFIKKRGAYISLRNTNQLRSEETKVGFELKSEDIEEEILDKYQSENPHKFNSLIAELIGTLQIEKKEDENNKVFEERLLADTRRVLRL